MVSQAWSACAFESLDQGGGTWKELAFFFQPYSFWIHLRGTGYSFLSIEFLTQLKQWLVYFCQRSQSPFFFLFKSTSCRHLIDGMALFFVVAFQPLFERRPSFLLIQSPVLKEMDCSRGPVNQPSQLITQRPILEHGPS